MNSINSYNKYNFIKPDYSNLKTFIISLKDYRNNYEKQLPHLKNLGLHIECFDGINALKNEHLKPELKQYISKFALNFTPNSVIGCALSHMLCCKHIHDKYINFNNNECIHNKSSYEGNTPFFLIMEDDAFPLYSKEDFYNKLNETLYEIKLLDKDWDIIQLHSDCIFPTTETYNTHFASGSTAAYLISVNGIKKNIRSKIYSHMDFIEHNFIKFRKYRTKENLFYTNEKDSLNRNINKTKNLSYYSLYIKSNVLELINKYTNLLKLRGEKTYTNFLEFKLLKDPFIKKEYNANELIDYFLGFIILKQFVKKLH